MRHVAHQLWLILQWYLIPGISSSVSRLCVSGCYHQACFIFLSSCHTWGSILSAVLHTTLLLYMVSLSCLLVFTEVLNGALICSIPASLPLFPDVLHIASARLLFVLFVYPSTCVTHIACMISDRIFSSVFRCSARCSACSRVYPRRRVITCIRSVCTAERCLAC